MSVFDQILQELPADASSAQIESTASDLESMNYDPLFLVNTLGFFRMKKVELGVEMNRVLLLPVDQASDELKSKQIQLLAYYYELLGRLRLNVPAAWDVINELYEDD